MDPRLSKDIEEQLLAARLPTLPAVAMQLVALARSSTAGVSDLVDVVAPDPAISIALVRRANAASSARASPAETLSQAVSYLGFEPARTLALSASLVPELARTGQPAFCYRPYWRRSLIAGVCARAIAKRLWPKQVEQLGLAALVQDIGILALAQTTLSVYNALDVGSFTHRRAIQHERHAIHDDHAAVGGWLLERWGFPAEMVRAVRLSNNLAWWKAVNDEGADFAAGVMASGLLADLWTSRGTTEVQEKQSDVIALLRLPWSEIIEIFTEAASDIPRMEALAGMTIDDIGQLQLTLAMLAKDQD